MATKRSSQPAGRGVKDAEVKSVYHDELLNWLIDNLAVVVADRWSMSPETVEQVVKQSRKEAMDSAESEARESFGKYADLESDGRGVQIDDEARNACALAASRLPDVLKRIESIKASETLGHAVIISHEVMKRVSRTEVKAVGAGRNRREEETRVDAGYVDLAAECFSQTGIQIAGFIDDGAHDYFDARRYGSGGRSKSLMRKAQAFTPERVTLTTGNCSWTTWFTVRTGAFTLGEILQELKELSVLEDEEQKVVLVVDGIDAGMRSKIEREGFAVVDRDTYR